MIPHENRYPKHEDAEKGQVHGGVCNITMCDNDGAVLWNGITYGFYCNRCGTDINKYSPVGDICFALEQDPTPEEMKQIHDRIIHRGKQPPSREDVPQSHNPMTYVISDPGFDGDLFKPSKKARLRAQAPRPAPAVTHVMTRQKQRAEARKAAKGRA